MATAIKKQLTVKNAVVYVYRDESMKEIIGTTYVGYGLVATELNDEKTMMYSPAYGGWISNDNVTITKTYNVSDTTVNTDYISLVPNTIENIVAPALNGPSDSSLLNASTSDLNAIIGMPYQFLDRVDRRIGNFGRKYSDKILTRDNFLYLMPGKQIFMPGATSSDKANTLATLADLAMNGASLDVNSIIKNNSRYYGLEPALDTYFEYVNAAARSVAILMDIGNVEVEVGGARGKLSTFNWQNALNNTLGSLFGSANMHLVIYTDGLNQVSEDFGNSTRESSLVSQVNGYSDTVKEINYIMNGSADSAFADMLQNDSTNATFSAIQESINNFTGGHGVLQAMLGNTTTILSGGKLVFPEMWSDSDYDRSYSVDIKLRTPDADQLSIYLNLIVPFIHLEALTAPRDFDSALSSNGYVAPFLVKAYFRSLFNIDLGIITSLSVTKGGEGNWAASSNLPTSIDISLGIKDLYKSIYITKVANILGGGTSDFGKFIANDAEMEQLMNLAGVNTTQANVDTKMRLAAGLAAGTVTDVLKAPGNKLQNELYKTLHNIFG